MLHIFVETKKNTMIYTIEDLRNGLCAVRNDGTLEELRYVLKKAFPNDIYPIYGSGKFYFKLDIDFYQSRDYQPTNIPIQSVKDFLKKENEEVFKWGEEVEVSAAGELWSEVLYIGINPITKLFVCADKNRNNCVFNFMFCRRPQPKTVQVTLNEIAEWKGVDVSIIKIVD